MTGWKSEFFGVMFFAIASLLTACAPPPSPQINPNEQAALNTARAAIESVIGKPIWVDYSVGFRFCDAPTSCFASPPDLSKSYIGPFYIKDVLLTNWTFDNANLYLVVTTTDGTTKYWPQGIITVNTIRDRLSSRLAEADIHLENPNVRAAREKAARDRKGPVSIGMTEGKVLLSCWGKPEQKNTTQTAKGRDEQWVYDGGHNYLYFENGILISIQTSR
jgi:hypothetical protein